MKSDEIIEKLRSKLKGSDPSNRSVMNIFQFHFTDSDGNLIKSMVFDFKELNIYDGTNADAEAEITISDENFYLVGSKQKTFDDLMANNNMKMEGDKDALNKLAEKFRMNAKQE
ncbi:eucalyptus isoform X1 [Haematobia irritans]|uniref:eucalyptus isoform X1 n=1 Tax=Haematobia irritans TaxID=7368 RepID=UPI003F500723